jgi:DNA-binding response OmpR family regulator
MRILIVEDEKKIANFIQRGLQEEHYEVHIAADGEEGLRLALEKRFDLVVLDWTLPKKDGLSVLRDLRENKNITPVLMLTAKDSVEDIVAGLDSGSDDYLTKPFAFSELLARGRALVRRSEQKRGAQISFANLRLDPVTHKVWCNDKGIDITGKEYNLLEYFMRNPNQVVTRTMIAEHCWDYTVGTFTNIIDVYVNHLRNKIDCDTNRKLIHTVRGVGYIFNEE